MSPGIGLGRDRGPPRRRESARASFTVERVGCTVLALGIITECHRLSIDYAKSRTLWGQEIGRFQLIQLKLAEMEVARLNVQNMISMR